MSGVGRTHTIHKGLKEVIAQVSLFACLLIFVRFGLGANLCWRSLNPKLLCLAALVRQHRFLIKVAARVLHEAAGFAHCLFIV